MSNIDRYPSYIDCVAQILSDSAEPMSLESIIAHVERRRPMTKGARSAIYKAVEQLFQAVPVAPARFGWLSFLLAGSTIRHRLHADEVRRGYLMLDELEHALFFPQFFQNHEPDGRVVQVDLFGDGIIHAEAGVERRTWSLRLGEDMVRWLDEQGAMTQDDLLIHVGDAMRGMYHVRLQPREVRNEEAIKQRNIQLARLAETIIVERGATETPIYTWELAACLIGRGAFQESIPPDDLHYALKEYSRLEFVDGTGYGLAANDAHPAQVGRNTQSAGRLQDLPQQKSKAPKPTPSNAMDDDWRQFEEEVRAMKGSLDQENDDACLAYEDYLAAFEQSRQRGEPLSHDNYHLLEAELEALVELEMEFGYLMPDQAERKQELADRLFIDPEALLDTDWDEDDDFDGDGPVYWQN
jgi:hypothetical protein